MQRRQTSTPGTSTTQLNKVTALLRRRQLGYSVQATNRANSSTTAKAFGTVDWFV